jgi:hypothetical protein
MKKLYTFAVFLLLGMAAHSQITDVITGLGNPSRIIIIDNTMYIADNSTFRISKTDFTAPNPVLTTLFEGLDFPYGLHLAGSDIYVSTITEISKFNYNDPTPTLEVVATGLSGPDGIIQDGNLLYVAEYFGNQISQIDLLSANPTPEVIVPAASPDQLVLVGNILYYSEYGNNKISKIDISLPIPTPIDVVTGLNGPTGLLLLGNDLYITEFNGNAILKIDITDPIPTVVVVQTGFDGPTDIARVDNEFYVVEYRAGKISKFTDPTLSIDQFNPAQTSISMYPNPTNNVLKLSGLTDTQSYTVYSLTGSIIKEGSVSNNETINVQNLSNGLYFLKLESGSNFKFIKN